MKRLSKNMGAMAVALALSAVGVQARSKDRDQYVSDRTATAGDVLSVTDNLRVERNRK